MIDLETLLYLATITLSTITFVKHKCKNLFKLIEKSLEDGHLDKDEFDAIMAEAGRIVRFLFKTKSKVEDVL